MRTHLERELQKLNEKFTAFTSMVEENYSDAVDAVVNADLRIARSVIAKDREIDLMEIEIEEECLKILALHQPVARDLRYIISILKINVDLERIGDLSSNIAARVVQLIELGQQPGNYLVPKMCNTVKEMLRNSLDSVLRKDTELAKKVLSDDSLVDEMHGRMYDLVGTDVEKDIPKRNYKIIQQYASLSRFLERIADHATNVAEDLIYMIDGSIIRHNNLIHSNSANEKEV